MSFREPGNVAARRPRQRDIRSATGLLRLEMSAEAYSNRQIYGPGAIAFAGISVRVRGEKVSPRRPNGLSVSESLIRLDYYGDVLLLEQDMTATGAWVSLNRRLAASGDNPLDSILSMNAQPSVVSLAQAVGRRTIDSMDFGLVIDQAPMVKTVVSTFDGEAYPLAIPGEPIVVIRD
jgi:hypothetical protein